MSTAWEEIRVRTVLDLSEAKAKVLKTQHEDSNDAEQEALYGYVDVLERALLELGIEIHDNGAVSPVTPRNPTEGTTS